MSCCYCRSATSNILYAASTISPRQTCESVGAVYTFPQSVPRASPSATPEAPLQPEAHATDGPPPSSPLPPLPNTAIQSPQSPGGAAVAAAQAAVAAAAMAPDHTLPASVMLSEGAPEPASRLALVNVAAAPAGAVAAAPAPSELSDSTAADYSRAVTNPSAEQVSQVLQSEQQQHLPNQASQPLNDSIATSLESNSTATGTASASNASAATAVAVNTSAEPPIPTPYGVTYDLKTAASQGSCKTLWQLIHLTPNLTTWAEAIEVSCFLYVHTPCYT